MTECTGKRYWVKRIGEAKERYNEWCKKREPVGANYEEWQAWHAWRMARIEYFNTERSKLYGYSPKRSAATTQRARDLSGDHQRYLSARNNSGVAGS